MKYQWSLLGLWGGFILAFLLILFEHPLAGFAVMLAGIAQACIFYRCPHCKKSLMKICGIHNYCPHCGGELFEFRK